MTRCIAPVNRCAECHKPKRHKNHPENAQGSLNHHPYVPTVCGLEVRWRWLEARDPSGDAREWYHVGTPSRPHEVQLAPSEPAQRG